MDFLIDFFGHRFLHYVDFLWIPVAFIMVHKRHRTKAAVFVLACLMTFRTQVQLMESTGYVTGFLPILESHVYNRGLVAYSILIALYLILAYFSPRTAPIVFFAASLSVYILAFCITMLIMAL